jgi:integrase
LSDKELAALWRVTEKLGYPFGPLYQVLLLTGARKNEWAAARWNEIDLDAGFLTVPPERFKSNATHLIPLTKQVRVILTALPRLDCGDYVFSASLGAFPIRGFQKAKLHIDALMKQDLAAAPPPWVTHDIRRTVRTKLASLRVADIVAEMIIGHGRRGLQRVYDQHSYEPEMREALELWAARLRSIVEPPPQNVIELERKARA